MKNEIPKQQHGAHTDVVSHLVLDDEIASRDTYALFKSKLKAIYNWTDYCSTKAARFFLADEQGRVVTTDPRVGFYIKIDVPGPGSAAGKGYDWVTIEDMGEVTEAGQDLFFIKVRPAVNPQNRQAGTAHFFKEEATSTFLVRRMGNEVSVEVHGRNELTNTAADKLTDKIRNAAVGLAGMLGISVLQWQSLTDGIVGKHEDNL